MQVERTTIKACRLAGNQETFSQCVNASRTYNYSEPYHSIDGSSNENNPLRGASNTAFRRLLPAEYEDEINVPIGTNQTVNGDPFSGPWPSPRTITRNIARDIIINSQVFSMIFTLFGQFLVLDFARFGEYDIKSHWRMLATILIQVSINQENISTR